MKAKEHILRKLAREYQERHWDADATGAEEPWIKEIAMPEKVTPLILMRIPAGCGWVGVRTPEGAWYGLHRHRVHVPQDFWLGQTPITADQWAVLTGSATKKAAALPKVEISWNQVAQLLIQLNGHADYSKEGTWRFPFEAEWEYACRADTLSEYWCGEDETALAEVGWYGGNTSKLVKVTSFPSDKTFEHPLGLLHMHGLVWEWCQDDWQEYPSLEKYPYAINAHASESDDPTSNPVRVFRGGSWGVGAARCRSSSRNGLLPDDWVDFLGFRLCLSPRPSHDQQA
jgi:formylglycine-generating enzyme required for sulfatase activity